MKIEIFALCDAATESGGKLNVIGTFDHIWATDAPVTHPLCSLALRIRFDRIEEGNHRLRITFGDVDGKLVMPGIDGSLAVRFGQEETTATANVVVHVQQIKLERFGEYSIDIAIDGRHEGSIPLYVKQKKESVGA